MHHLFMFRNLVVRSETKVAICEILRHTCGPLDRYKRPRGFKFILGRWQRRPKSTCLSQKAADVAFHSPYIGTSVKFFPSQFPYKMAIVSEVDSSENKEPTIAVRRTENAVPDTVVNSSLQDTSRNSQNVQQPPPQEEPLWKRILYQLVMFFIVMQVMKAFTGKKQVTNMQSTSGTTRIPSSNLFKVGERLEMYLYYSEKEDLVNFDNKKMLWHEKDLVFGNWYDGPYGDGTRKISGHIDISDNVINNGSLYYHVYFVKEGFPPNSSLNSGVVAAMTKQMNIYKKQRVHKTKNLLTGEADNQHKVIQTNSSEVPKIISYWHPNLTLTLLDDQTQWQNGSIPSPLDQYIKFHGDGKHYYPVIYFNDYWNYLSDYMPINETTPKLEFSIIYSPISMFKWQMYISQSMRSQWNQYLGDTVEQTDMEQDMIKRTLRETNPYLLGLTMIVSLVHSVFEFLAFKNDIQFWKSRKTLEGLSVRSIFFNVFQSLIVLLYVFDNETNTIVVVSCFVGLIIECWKITKVVDIKQHPTRRWGPFPALAMEDKSTYVESSTKEYDRLAFKYLSWVLFPLLGCYAVYSLVYVEHKGWYSFVLSMAYGFLLTFGFIMMTPQLFINYKLKSVAHLPWRMLTYKALNTFIDDIFAFVIKMPTLYRLGCLRDDVIFFIFLYQKWIYPVDLKRVNEFGVTGEVDTENDKGTLKPADNDNDSNAAESKDTKKDK